MPKKRERSAVGQVEREFMEALQRIEDKNPTNPELILMKRRGTLKVNIATVAKEAGHSRTLISHARCAYPRVRDAVLGHKQTIDLPGSMTEVCRKLRVDLAETRRGKHKAYDSMAAMIRRMAGLEKDAKKAISGARRREPRGDRDPNEIVGDLQSESVKTKLVLLPKKKQ